MPQCEAFSVSIFDALSVWQTILNVKPHDRHDPTEFQCIASVWPCQIRRQRYGYHTITQSSFSRDYLLNLRVVVRCLYFGIYFAHKHITLLSHSITVYTIVCVACFCLFCPMVYKDETAYIELRGPNSQSFSFVQVIFTIGQAPSLLMYLQHQDCVKISLPTISA